MIEPMNPQETPVDGRVRNPPPPDAAALAADLGRSLQLSRASALALTRLQLAMKSSDRQATMAALDRLHALDAEMERLVGHLPAPVTEDPAWQEWDAIARHLGDQKLALAFEKLAVASEISGPDLVSAREPQHFHPPARFEESSVEEWPASHHSAAQDDDPPPLADWPHLRAAQPKAVPSWVWQLLAAVLVMAAFAAVVVAMTWGWI
jgi:hypothetical protein